jgi:hypothetical protein
MDISPGTVKKQKRGNRIMNKIISLVFILILASVMLVTACNNNPGQTIPTSTNTITSASTTPSTVSTKTLTSSSLSTTNTASTNALSSSTTTSTSAVAGTSSPSSSTYMPIPRLIIGTSSIPKLGETVDLTFKISMEGVTLGADYRRSLINSRVWIDVYRTNLKGSYSEAKYSLKVPINEILVSGDTSWQGDASWGGVELKSKIRLPREGFWKFEGSLLGDKWDRPLTAYTKYVLLDGKSQKYDYFNPDSKAGPLGYLSNFNYGEAGHPTLNETITPIIVEADISKAPRVGEEVTVTANIVSLHDVPNFSAYFNFVNRSSRQRVPASTVLVSGQSNWTGDLKANQTVQFSANIKLPETGEWEIYVEGNSKENLANHFGGYANSILITIEPDKSYFGWVGR